MCMLCNDLSPSYVIYQTAVASELSRTERIGVLWQTQNVMTNGNLCLESASGKRRKPYGARERSIAAARDLLSSGRNCTGEGGRDGTTDGHGPPEALGLRGKEMRSLSSQFSPLSSERAWLYFPT